MSLWKKIIQKLRKKFHRESLRSRCVSFLEDYASYKSSRSKKMLLRVIWLFVKFCCIAFLKLLATWFAKTLWKMLLQFFSL